MAKRNGVNDSSTIISAGTEIVGDLSFRGHLQIDGSVFGNLIADDRSKASVTVGDKGRVIGEISVPTVTVSGRITGDVHSCENLVIKSSANIQGNMYCNIIEVASGAVLEGKMGNIYRGLPEECPAMPKKRTRPRDVVGFDFSTASKHQ